MMFKFLWMLDLQSLDMGGDRERDLGSQDFCLIDMITQPLAKPFISYEYE